LCLGKEEQVLTTHIGPGNPFETHPWKTDKAGKDKHYDKSEGDGLWK